MSPSAPMTRPRVALAGTSGFIGAALCEALGARCDLRILTRSMARTAERPQDDLRPCDHFSRKELLKALEGVDGAIYLVHNRDPSARLDQAQARDMDLLVADNFAWAAARNGVKQIVCRAPLVDRLERPSARDAQERLEVMAAHGVPLTVLRTGLVVGPGGELARLLVRLVRRLPAIPLPALADRPLHPLHLGSLLAAFSHCVGNPETLGRAYDIGGPEAVTLRTMLEDAAALAGRRPRFLDWPDMPEGAFRALLRLVNPTLHPEFATYLVDAFASAQPGEANPVQALATRDWRPFRETLSASIQARARGLPRQQRRQDDEAIRQLGRVRSIQRLHLPATRNAQWLADHYFGWLGTLLKPFVATQRDPDGSWTVRQRPGGFRLLRLDFQPAHSSPDRRMYFITGGLLARALGGRTARLEFRDVLGGRFSLVAIHDFNPALPWLFYRFTQAVVHGLVMKGFQGHMEQLALGEVQI